MKRRAAVLVFLPSIDQAKQERAMLKWAEGKRYDITSVTHQPAAAAALAEAGLVDVVLVMHHSRATLEAAGRIGQTAAIVEEIRPSNTPLTSHDRTRSQILDAARRGVPAEAIAAVLDLPLSSIHEALGIASAETGRRPERLAERRTSPVVRRPQRVLSAPPGRRTSPVPRG